MRRGAAVVEAALARVDPRRSPQPGPTEEQVAAAQSMAAGRRAAMIEGMVERLAERLKGEPDDVEGWLRLIRSYAVLGRPRTRPKPARAALARASARLRDRERVEALIAELGLTPPEPTTP